MSPKT